MHIHTLDLCFLDHKQTIAAFLIAWDDHPPVLVETGPYTTFEQLGAAVARHGYRLSDIKHVFLTHIHFDHAGAAWALAEMGATIFLHPLGAPHLMSPEKLVQSATRIYGDDMDRLWGPIRPIAEEQLMTLNHGQSMVVNDQLVRAWHTPGHASHHIAWQFGSYLFGGDVTGVRIGNGPVVPPCPPPDIHLEDWQASLELIRSMQPELEAVYLTHFGQVDDISTHLDKLEKELLDWANWMKPHAEKNTPVEEVRPAFEAFVAEKLRTAGLEEEGIASYESANPSWMSVYGLLRYWKKHGLPAD